MNPVEWVLSPVDCQTHLLESAQPRDVLKARCGHIMPLGPSRHIAPPRLPVCVACAVLSEVTDDPVFPHPKFPAGRRSSVPVKSPGGQPDPSPTERVAAVLRLAGTGIEPCWVQCLVSGEQHLLTALGAAQAAGDGYVRAACGRRMGTNRISFTRLTGRPCAGCAEVSAGTVAPPLTTERIVTRLRTLLPKIEERDE